MNKFNRKIPKSRQRNAKMHQAHCILTSHQQSLSSLWVTSIDSPSVLYDSAAEAVGFDEAAPATALLKVLCGSDRG